MTKEQIRAQKVFKQIEQIKKESWAQDYGRICLSFPALVYQCGLCQAIAFGESKSDGREKGRKKAFYQYLSDLAEACSGKSLEAFGHEVRTADLGRYQQLTREVMAMANWYKRYAEAILKVEAGVEGGDNV